MKLYTSEVYDAVRDLLDTTAIKTALGAVQVCLGTQRYQPGNDHDARGFLSQLNAIIVTDGPGGDTLGPNAQSSTLQNYSVRVILLHKLVAGENAVEKMGTDMATICNALVGQRNISLDSAKARIWNITPGPGFKVYDSEASSFFRENGYDVVVGWLDVAVQVQAKLSTS